jgi:methyl-accepting chemotaxis protein
MSMSNNATSTAPARRQSHPSASGLSEFFRYHGWLAPGVRLFRSITFTTKALCIGAAFVIPLLITLYHLSAAATEQIGIARMERDGIRYVRPLLAYVAAAQELRAAAASESSDLQDKQDKAKAAFTTLQTVQGELGASFLLEKSFGQLKAGHETLASTPKRGTVDETFKAHVDHLHDAFMLLREVSDGSQLALDPELDTYHLMNVAVLRGPREAENTERIRELGAIVLASGELSPRRRDWISSWMAVHAYLDEDVENSYQQVVDVTPEVSSKVDMKATDAAFEAFASTVRQQLLAGQVSGDPKAFSALGNTAVEMQTRLNSGLLDRLDTQLQARIDRLSDRLKVQIATSLAFVALAAYLLFAFYRVMMGGLREVAVHLKAITNGNLTTCPTPWGRDEAAALMVTMGEMQASLRQIVGNVLESSRQVQGASEEIASASNDLSGRTEQTAASLEETASSMEQISATVKQTAATVQGAMSIVRENASSATRGGEVISEVISTMDGIHTSSKKIGEIIGVIDGIAFQTNILALNAAVEAARAGEQGRGFAVVATEVRALAGRSAMAAKEIKTLISGSIEQVQNGNRIAAEAGNTVREIVSNAERITTLMSEISEATQQQSAGVGLVGSAVQELDRSTQQNAALVEQTSASAGILSDQAVRLATEVGFFKLA